ncbi:MAG: 16S rRNA (adenine(1518)-N(6)/adenine(1519)-N(6))-dimethyltransferase RsmA [Firmicutes bacterium]|nr:16S rRNA (adenine(1518)-N(6)/adenine(1519)-N(6))-dimethyltransferase RsmA [Bacillota bacterium]
MPENLTSAKAVQAILTRHGLSPLKSLGQNFLIDANIQQKIVAAGALTKDDLVVEIGPGLGALTAGLIDKAGMVIAVEYDRGLYSILKERYGAVQNLQLANLDFLKSDLESLCGQYVRQGFQLKVMANLPYYITSPAIFKIIESKLNWGRLIFLVQKEVGDRICAKAGSHEYGAMTVLLNYFGQVEKIMNVPRTVFFPAPQVDSALVRIEAREAAGGQDGNPKNFDFYPYLRRVVQAGFGQRRKTILNALAPFEELFGGKSALKNFLTQLEIHPERRGETLQLEEFMLIAKEVYERENPKT